jgi:hypothetical protein
MSIRDALQHASGLTDEVTDSLADAAHARAHDFGPARFAREVAGFVEDLTGVRLSAGRSPEVGQARDGAAMEGTFRA